MTQRKDILHLIISLERGGFETALLRMLPHLQEDFTHTIITLQKPGVMAPLFEEKGIKVFCLEQKSLFDLSSYFRLVKLVRSQKPALILTYLFHADAVGRCFLQFFVSCKVISSLGTTYNFKRYWPARLFERLSKYLADGYIANAPRVREVYMQRFGVDPKKIWVMPCGLDIGPLEKTPASDSLRTEIGVRKEDFIIICVANLHINKGHRFLLEAFEQFSRQYPDSKLFIVGEGEERAALINQIQKYTSKDKVFFLGRRPDVPALLALSQVFVLPTFFEGLSNAIMEAMAARVLVITTDIPENRQLIIHQETGLLCPPQDVDCLHQALVKARENDYFSLRENAYVKIKREYGMPEKIALWKNVFHQLS